jgi:hypothetical protein
MFTEAGSIRTTYCPSYHDDWIDENATEERPETKKRQIEDISAFENNPPFSRPVDATSDKVRRVQKKAVEYSFSGEVIYQDIGTIRTTYNGPMKNNKWHGENGTLQLEEIGTFSGRFEEGELIEGIASFVDGKTLQGKFLKGKYIPIEFGRFNLQEVSKPGAVSNEEQKKPIDQKITKRMEHHYKKNSFCKINVQSENDQYIIGYGTVHYKKLDSKWTGVIKIVKATGQILQEGNGTLTMSDGSMKKV